MWIWSSPGWIHKTYTFASANRNGVHTSIGSPALPCRVWISNQFQHAWCYTCRSYTVAFLTGYNTVTARHAAALDRNTRPVSSRARSDCRAASSAWSQHDGLCVLELFMLREEPAGPAESTSLTADVVGSGTAAKDPNQADLHGSGRAAALTRAEASGWTVNSGWKTAQRSRQCPTPATELCATGATAC